MTETCLCGHSIHYHFMDFGPCHWSQAVPGGFVPCDCRVYEQGNDQ